MNNTYHRNGRWWQALVVLIAQFTFTGAAQAALMHDWILTNPNGDLEYRALGNSYSSVGWVRTTGL